jgi:hypothetical protein
VAEHQQASVTQQILQDLIADGEKVANVGVRLGKLKGVALLNDLAFAKKAAEGNGDQTEAITRLETSLGPAVSDIAPITLIDLRDWSPFSAESNNRVAIWLFGVFALILICATAYLTQVYDRARSLYANTVELQNARAAERATQLFGLLKRNQQDVIEALSSGKKDFLYETFSSALYDLEVMNIRFQTYAPIAASVLRDLDVTARLKSIFVANANSSNPSNNAKIAQYLESVHDYGPAPEYAASAASGPAAAATPVDLAKMDVSALLARYITDLRQFNSTINVNFDPLFPNDYSYNLVQLQNGMRFLGSWLLPGLYGMLGAVVFHMRRLLDPNLPNPRLLRFVYRIVLGGFGGIVLVWFWIPSGAAPSMTEFAPLTSFGLAFLIGFSSDVFFQVLDRLVAGVSGATVK